MNSLKLRFCCGVVLSLLLIVVILFAAQVRNPPADELTTATVCQMIRQPEGFKGKAVRVNALVESDLIEHTVLTDESCGSYGISLWIPHDLDDNANVKALRNALKEQWKPGAAKTHVFAVFTGIFSVEGKKRFLKVSKVEDIHVRGT